MKLDKFGKKWAKIAGVVFLVFFFLVFSANLLGGLHSPVEGKIWITTVFLVVTVGAMALAFFTELEE